MKPPARNQRRATDRLNTALARIAATADLLEQFEPSNGNGNGNKEVTALPIMKKLASQLSEAIDEAYAAISDIRHVTDQL